MAAEEVYRVTLMQEVGVQGAEVVEEPAEGEVGDPFAMMNDVVGGASETGADGNYFQLFAVWMG
eukprot:1822641-Alexandrium_andersonii.AAC.1